MKKNDNGCWRRVGKGCRRKFPNGEISIVPSEIIYVFVLPRHVRAVRTKCIFHLAAVRWLKSRLRSGLTRLEMSKKKRKTPVADGCRAIARKRPQNQFGSLCMVPWYISLIWRNQFEVSLWPSDEWSPSWRGRWKSVKYTHRLSRLPAEDCPALYAAPRPEMTCQSRISHTN